MFHLDVSLTISNLHEAQQQSPSLTAAAAAEEMTVNDNQQSVVSPMEYQEEKTSNPIHSETNEEQSIDIQHSNPPMITTSSSSDVSTAASSLLPISSSSRPSTTDLTENKKTSEHSGEEEGERKEAKEEYRHDNTVDVEKKNNCSSELNHHASGIVLTNVDSLPTVFLPQEKKEDDDDDNGEGEQERQLQPQPREGHSERPTSSTPREGQCNQQPLLNDESIVATLLNDQKKVTMSSAGDAEQRYKAVEIEEIPDDEETLLEQRKNSIEPTDYIHTDEELQVSRRQSLSQSNASSSTDVAYQFGTVLSCYEKALAKAVETLDDSIVSLPIPPQISSLPPIRPTLPVDTHKAQRPEDDPIALRALQRFEQRMNAAVTTKTAPDEATAKGKSSWSGTPSNPRKSLENIFKNKPSLQSSTTSTNDETIITASQPDTFIRPRRTMLDEGGFSFGLTLNLFGPASANDTQRTDHHAEEQELPKAMEENDNIDSEYTTTNSCLASLSRLSDEYRLHCEMIMR